MRPAVVLLLLLLLPAPAWAAVVEAVAVPGFGGTMTALRPGARTGEATARLPDGETLPLGPGVELPVGARIDTRRARVVLRLDSDELLHIEAASAVELGAARSVQQHLGEVYYRVREAFTVQYGTVETAVEGTRFLVAGETEDGGPVRVSVDEGVVTVRTPGGARALAAGETLVAPADAAPGAPGSWGAVDRGRALGQMHGAGPPRLLIGGLVLGGLTGAVASERQALPAVGTAGGRLLASARVRGPVRATAGVALGGGPRAAQLPLDAGVELMLGPVAVGGSAAVLWEERRPDCGGSQTWLHVGGLAKLRAELPLGRRLRLLGAAQVGAVGTPTADLGLGLGVVL